MSKLERSGDMSETEKNIKYPNVAVIVLAAGKGTRFNGLANSENKTVKKVHGKPMVEMTVDSLDLIGFGQKIAVVGHAAGSVRNVLRERVKYAEQSEQLGTGHAVESAIEHLAENIDCVVVLNGDDSFLYKTETLEKLVKACENTINGMSLLTLVTKNPEGKGRILRGPANNVIAIVEEKNATEEQRKTREINAGAYCFVKSFLIEEIGQIQANPVNQERYLTDMVDIAIKSERRVVAIEIDPTEWHGINNIEELNQANS